MSDKVTVIVPVYNTEQFLDRCLSSVVNQTHQDIELIIINDGSTDHSGEICKRYSNQDSRIRYFEQSNSGQGVARNRAMKEATGEYFAFLDSDDYWDSDYIECLLKDIHQYDADIAVCAYRFVTENDELLRRSVRYPVDTIKTYNGVEAAKNILYWLDFGASPWAKLFKRSVWEGLCYPEDRIYEDLAITYRVCLNAKRVVFDAHDRMSYVQRNNSDIHMKFNNRKIKVLDTADEILAYTMNNCPSLIKAAKSRIVAINFFILFQIPQKSEEYKDTIERCKRNIRKYRMVAIFDGNSRKKTRLGALVSLGGFRICRKIFYMMKKKDTTF